MELECENFFLSNNIEIPNFTQNIFKSNELCIICQLDEHEDDKVWERYKLVCGHIFHTRCFRKWCLKKQSINCPYCGDIKQININKFCNSCKIFGHQHLSCISQDTDDFFKFSDLQNYIKPIQEKKTNICHRWNCNICNSKVNDFSFESQKKHFTSKKCIKKQNILFENII
jgi:hypothetical protein